VSELGYLFLANFRRWLFIVGQQKIASAAQLLNEKGATPLEENIYQQEQRRSQDFVRPDSKKMLAWDARTFFMKREPLWFCVNILHEARTLLFCANIFREARTFLVCGNILLEARTYCGLRKYFLGGANLFGLRKHFLGGSNHFWFAQTF
jgi:hypothetical protein